MVPAVPCFCDDGLERGELVVGHVEGAEEVLFEERGTGEGKEEGGGKGLAADEICLWKGRLV